MRACPLASTISYHLFNLAVFPGARFHGNFWPLKHCYFLGLHDIYTVIGDVLRESYLNGTVVDSTPIG